MVRAGNKTRRAAAVLGNGVTADDIVARVRRCLPMVKTANANRKRLNTTDALTAVFLLREMCDAPGDSYDISLEKASTKIKYAAPFFKDQVFIAWNCLGGLLSETAIEPEGHSERWRSAPILSPSVLASALDSPQPIDSPIEQPVQNDYQAPATDSGTDSDTNDAEGPPTPAGSVASNASSPSGSPVRRETRKVRFRPSPASVEGPKRSRRRRNGTTPPTLTGMAALCRQRLARLAGLAQDAIDAFEGTEISRAPLFHSVD